MERQELIDEAEYWKQLHKQDVATFKEELKLAEEKQKFCFSCGLELSEDSEPFAYYYEHKMGDCEPQFSIARWDIAGRKNWVETPLYEMPNVK